MAKERILIAGGTGLVGNRLQELIPKEKYDIHILSRKKRSNKANIKYFTWDIDQKTIEDGAVMVDHIINLTGAGIADSRWTDTRKQVLISSRTESLNLLRSELKRIGHRPKSFSGASAIGYYGDRKDEILTEESAAGNGFLAECCKSWELASAQCAEKSERGMIYRIGIVLSTKGGALPKILMTKGIRVLNYFGDGSQFYSWIHIDDLCQMILSGMMSDRPSGVYNAVSPEPQTNKIFTQKIGTGLTGSYAVIPAPAFALKLALGEMSAVVLDSARVSCQKIIHTGFKFQFSDVPEAIQDLMRKNI